MYDNIESKIVKSNLNEYLGKNKPVNLVEPLVSVVVETYQHVGFIEACLNSILQQVTNFPIEIIVGEDESSDGTREICMKHAKNNPDRLRLFLRERKDNIYFGDTDTPSSTFNSLANNEAARGKYIAACEGDDYWTDPYKLQKQVDYMENNAGCLLCTHAAIMVDATDKKIKDLRPHIGNTRISLEYAITIGNKEATSSFLWIKSMTSNMPQWALNAPVGDTPLYLMAAYRGFVGYIDEFMSVYRKGAQSSWSTMKNQNIELELYNNLGKYDMYNGFNIYSNGLYSSLIAKRKRHYVKRLLLLIDSIGDKKLFNYLKVIKHLQLYDKSFALLVLTVYLPLIKIKRIIKKRRHDMVYFNFG